MPYPDAIDPSLVGTYPAVTKAGGFGNEESLKRVISRLRFIRQTGTVA